MSGFSPQAARFVAEVPDRIAVVLGGGIFQDGLPGVFSIFVDSFYHGLEVLALGDFPSPEPLFECFKESNGS